MILQTIYDYIALNVMRFKDNFTLYMLICFDNIKQQ